MRWSWRQEGEGGGGPGSHCHFLGWQMRWRLFGSAPGCLSAYIGTLVLGLAVVILKVAQNELHGSLCNTVLDKNLQK